jgi:LacI family transcriptional regulator
MKDIAQALGVSVVTVSKVMRDHQDIGPETRQRVLDKAKELSYRPNLTARSLVTGQSYQVGVIVPTLLHPFFAEVLEALSSTMKQNGYAVMISSSMEDPAIEEAAIEQLLGHRMDGLIVASCSTSPAKFQQLKEQGIPFVMIDRFFPEFKTNFVGVDDRAVGRMATEHLIAMGCKRIAHIRGLPFTTGVGRFEGYKQALAKHGMKFDPSLVSPYMTADGRDWQLHYDSSLKASLSSMDHHSSQIGARAAKLLLHLLKDKTSKSLRQVVLQPSLVVRESSVRRGMVPVNNGNQRS